MDDDIDRLLGADDGITPSSGFLRAVMAAVEREAAAPRPLAFPWLRALPGFAATLAALFAATWNAIGVFRDPAAAAEFAEQLRRLALLADAAGLQWIALAAAITVGAAMLPAGLLRVGHGA